MIQYRLRYARSDAFNYMRHTDKSIVTRIYFRTNDFLVSKGELIEWKYSLFYYDMGRSRDYDFTCHQPDALAYKFDYGPTSS